MAAAARRRHGNMPQRRATLLPRGYQRSMAKQVTATAPERPTPGTPRTTGPNLPGRRKLSGIEMGPGWTFLCKAKTSPSPPQQPQNHPAPPSAPSTLYQMEPDRQRRVHSEKNKEVDRKDGTTAATLKKLRIHPEAQRILGSSCIATVRLERLRIRMDPGQSVSLSVIQPWVSLVMSELLTEDAAASPPEVMTPENQVQQTRCRQDTEQSSEGREKSSGPGPGVVEAVPTQTQDWTEPLQLQERPASPSPPTEPAQESPELESESDSESEPEWDQGLKSGCDSNSPEKQSDLEQESKPELNLSMESEPKSESEENVKPDCEPDGEGGEASSAGHCVSVDESEVSEEQPGREAGPAGTDSEDFCAVCLNGGDLLCCDGCPKVYHLSCHIPPLFSFPLGDWVCTLCRSDQDPGVEYDCESVQSATDPRGAVTPYTLSSLNQRRCEKLTLLLSTHILSTPFQEPVSQLARHYYQIIKRPMDLSVIRRKLDHRNTLHYFTAEQFVDDVLLMFRNCATFNYPDSEVANAGRHLEVFFLAKLREVFPDQDFPMQTKDRADRTSVTWQNRKRRDYHRKKKKSHFLVGRSNYF